MATNREGALEIALIGVLAAADQQGLDLKALGVRAKELISLYPSESLNSDERAAGAVHEIDKAHAKVAEGKRLSGISE
ncbi:hypothetical protein [Pseudomonas weihenstephanensis]|uniref:hypothetical protein n=1 Tax=Pseudomonas weihenstephanensis TaxID=1608994 RepID=UPI00193BEFA1|nr:hypothetical protein [Pseudomonas weihenstephanensis]MBM1191573.1 hypothetical protein [Pseudomonas weihenstephanensis]